MGLGDFETALAMRDVMQTLVAAEVEKQRPRYQYATVTGIDRPSRKCSVQFPGEATSVSVNMGSIQPSAVGQTVRIEGLAGDRFVGDVLGLPWMGDTVGNAVLSGSLTAAKIIAAKHDIGSGYAHGNNYMERYQSGAWNCPNVTWTDYAFNSENTAVETATDDGPIWTSPYFQSQVAGYYLLSTSVTFGGGNGFKAVRVITEGGTQIGREGFDQVTTPFRDMTLTVPMWLPGGGYGVKVQVYQSTGASLAMTVNAPTTPAKATFIQIT